jgi:phosphatidylserine decarboxylase
LNRTPALIRRLQRQETLNFWLTNRIPRRLLTTLTGRFSRIRSRRLTRWSIRIWQLFADDLRLDEAETTDFDSVHACFTRRLKPGARPVDPDPDALTSPCDAVVGANGPIVRETLLQAKGMRYRLDELVGGKALAARHAGGSYVTLRLKSSMYHRFHAPCDGRIREIGYFSGDVLNVNPPALRRIPGLFCRNERAVVPLETKHRLGPVTLVPVAAVLVASMRFAFLDASTQPARRGRHRIACDATVARGDELGWFEHGSTIVLLAGAGLVLAPGLADGAVVRTGRPLLVPGARSGDEPASAQSAAS